MADENKNRVEIVSEQGSVMMSLEEFGREGNRMTVQGSVMGAWSTRMYVSPQDAWKLFGLLLRWQVIGYILSLPYLLIKKNS
jgi:hypothetical protein